QHNYCHKVNLGVHMRGSLSFADDNVSKSVFIVEGIALTVFGVAAIAWPGLTVYAFLVLFGIYALVAGIANVIGGILKINKGWQAVATIVLGGLLIAAGSYVLNRPSLTATALVVLVAFAFLIRGIVDIVLAASEDTSHRGLSVVS